MKPRNQGNAAPMWAALSIPVIWCAVIFASCYVEEENLLVQISTFMTAAQTPFAVSFNHHTPRFILGALIAYAFGIACYYSCREKRRPGEEHGSAVWGSIRQLNAKYRDKKERENIILTNKVRLGLDGYKHMCTFAPLTYQQEDGLNTALPYGLRKIQALRTMTTESTAVLMPFKTQEIQDSGGIYYGVNAISHNLIICNRKYLLNGNGFILGVSGSGKSMAAKQEFAYLALGTNDDIIVIDPEREYSALCKAMGGETVYISASSNNHINALALNRGYGEGENPIVLKSEFVMSLCEQLIGAGKLGAREKSIIDRCIANVYRNYIRDYSGTPPTLKEFHEDLLKQQEPAAKDIALAIELFTTGSLNVFAHQTNVDMNSRITVFDIFDLGKQLKTVGMLVMLDAILNRVTANRQLGKRTHIFIDEIYLFFANEYSSNFLAESWKRFRKSGALVTGITQNIEDCLRSATARTMLANSEFLLMLNQAPTDRMELARLLNISDTQLSYITNAEAGHGLIKVGGAIVPFINEFPKDTALYRLMTTKPDDLA